MTCTRGAMTHLADAEPVCADCWAGLRAERLHVNPEAMRRAETAAAVAVHEVLA